METPSNKMGTEIGNGAIEEEPVDLPVDRISPASETAAEPDEPPSLSSSTTTSCCGRRAFLDRNPEAVAWALDSVGTSIAAVGSAAFLIPTLIKVNENYPLL